MFMEQFRVLEGFGGVCSKAPDMRVCVKRKGFPAKGSKLVQTSELFHTYELKQKPMQATIDFKAIVALQSLEAVITAELGSPVVRHGKSSWPCPFHQDASPSLYLFNGGKNWRCWPCNLHGDVIDWVAQRDGCTKVEAAKKLDPSQGLDPKLHAKRPRPRPTPNAKPVEAPRPAPWQDPEWQAAVDKIVCRATKTLWTERGRDALEWLRRKRGLEDHTIRRFHLGFIPESFKTEPLEVLGVDDEGKPKGISACRGICMPWCAPGSWFGSPATKWLGATVRRLRFDVWEDWTLPGKCLVLTGTKRVHAYPFPCLDPSQAELPCLIVEGELDALVAHQEAASQVVAATFGGASQMPRDEAIAELDACPLWLVSTDTDASGSRSAWDWHVRNPEKAKRVLLPHGKDLTEFHMTGGDVANWVGETLQRYPRHGPDVSPSWQMRAARMPHEQWVKWRNLSLAIQATYQAPIGEADIRLADREAYDEITTSR